MAPSSTAFLPLLWAAETSSSAALASVASLSGSGSSFASGSSVVSTSIFAFPVMASAIPRISQRFLILSTKEISSRVHSSHIFCPFSSFAPFMNRRARMASFRAASIFPPPIPPSFACGPVPSASKRIASSQIEAFVGCRLIARARTLEISAELLEERRTWVM